MVSASNAALLEGKGGGDGHAGGQREIHRRPLQRPGAALGKGFAQQVRP